MTRDEELDAMTEARRSMKRPLCICYHGTNKAAVAAIWEEGFQPFTYFARHLEDAIGFGGEYVFEVAFYTEDVEDFGWQFKALKVVPSDRIVSLRRYVVTQLYVDTDVRKKIFESNEEK